MIVVSDATPLIGLAKIGQLVLLQDMFGEVLVPQAVYNEVVWGAPHNLDAVEIRRSGWIRVRQVSDQMGVDYLRVDLDAGESEALVLAGELDADCTKQEKHNSSELFLCDLLCESVDFQISINPRSKK